MNYLNSDEWLIMDNILLGDINNFGLSIMMGVVQNEDDNPILIGEDGLSFVLTVYDRIERKKTECVFPSFEETAFFIKPAIAIKLPATYRLHDRIFTRQNNTGREKYRYSVSETPWV